VVWYYRADCERSEERGGEEELLADIDREEIERSSLRDVERANGSYGSNFFGGKLAHRLVARIWR
jgi:hypothetical protein